MFRLSAFFPLLLTLLIIQGCADVRNSYESLLDTGSVKPLITLKVGETHEVLAVGNGFPGWWGYYPAIVSHDPEVADVYCRKGRSLIPFREPGLIFGGVRCDVVTHKAGVAWLLYGNQFVILSTLRETDFSKVTGEDNYPPGKGEYWIKLKVVE